MSITISVLLVFACHAASGATNTLRGARGLLAPRGSRPVCPPAPEGGSAGGAGEEAERLVASAFPPGAWDPRAAPISDTDRGRIDVADAGKGQAGCSRGPSTYGEVTPRGHVELLRAVGAKAGQVYYDLGAGLGKGALVAWHLGLRARGVELSTEIFAESCKRMSSFFASAPAGAGGAGNVSSAQVEHEELRLFHGDVFSYDFSDANIVFLDNKCWPRMLMSKLTETLAQMPARTRIISALDLVVTADQPIVKTQQLCVPVTWSRYPFPVHIYEVQGTPGRSSGRSKVLAGPGISRENCTWPRSQRST